MRFFLLPCLLLSFFTTPVFPASNDSVDKLNTFLAREKVNLTQALHAEELLSKSDKILNQAALTTRKQQNADMLALVRVKIATLNDFNFNQRKRQQNLARRLKALQQLPLEKTQNTQAIDERMKYIEALKIENGNTIDLIGENLELAKGYEAMLVATQNRLAMLQANMTEQQHLDQLQEKIHQLKRERDKLYQKSLDLQQAKKANGSFGDNLNHEAELLLNNQAIILLQQQIIELGSQKKLLAADYLLLNNQDIKTISQAIDLYSLAIRQLSGIEQSLKKMQELLDNEQHFLSNARFEKNRLLLKKTVALRLKQVSKQHDFLQKELEKKQHQLNQKLASRQGLTEYHLYSWPALTSQLLHVPAQFYHYLKLLALKVSHNYLQLDAWSAVRVWGSLCSILLAGLALGRGLDAVVQGKQRSSMSGHLFDGALMLLYRNIPHLTIAAMLMTMFFLNHIVFENYQLLVNLFLVWLGFRNIILIARLMFLERISDSSGKDVKLYYRLLWLLLAGGWATALMVLSHQMPLSLLLQDIFNRLVMLFLLAVSLVAWKSKDVIRYLLAPLLKKRKKRYLRNAISLLAVLVPLTLLTTAIIGLVGYIDLAWTMSRYQAYVLLVMICYVLGRGLVLDGLDALSKWMITSLHNGWLWIEVILKPLDAIARVLLVLLAIVTLFQLFGWTADSQVVSVLQTIGKYPFVNLSGARITVYSALEFIVLLFVFIWFAKWTREFCFRWLYRHVMDSGVRNSLSVFTQYAVIILGGLLTLRVLGIDFTGMAIVFGGLAVGMGFGLRDFASNIVGGIMLLIERPVREGDLITLGEYEGRVAHIGIRSMRVSSWDHMEVLIPNAETFNKPFTNWTHQDSIVRTVVPIKVNRADDPCVVQQLIMDVLVIIPEVLNDPPPQVLLKQIDDVLIDFEIRYFVNVQHHTRFEIRSKVLFAIMAQFKAAGIRTPVPSLNVELNHDTHPASE